MSRPHNETFSTALLKASVAQQQAIDALAEAHDEWTRVHAAAFNSSAVTAEMVAELREQQRDIETVTRFAAERTRGIHQEALRMAAVVDALAKRVTP